MSGTKAAKQKATERARLAAIAAEEAAWKRHRRRRFEIAGGAVALVALIILIVVLASGGDDKTTLSTATSKGSTATTKAGTATTAAGTATTAAPALTSAAGKPCVAMADPLPEGAPKVDVVVGPPPAALIEKDIKAGKGATVKPGDTVTVNYIGVSCSTGKIFDTSYGGNPATFSLNGVIKGWTDGIPGMKVGGQRLLGIPSEQGYASGGYPPDIAPDEALWFVVEVLETKSA